MKNTMNIIPNTSIEFLTELKGAWIHEVYVECSSLVGKGEVYSDNKMQKRTISTGIFDHLLTQMVVLHTRDHDFSFWTTEIENRPNEYPDLALVEVMKDPPSRFESQIARLASYPANAKIRTMEILNEHVQITEPGEQPFILTNTKAIIIHFDDKKIVLEKDCYWSECWAVTLLPNDAEYVFYDEWKEKADDDFAEYQVTMEHQFI